MPVFTVTGDNDPFLHVSLRHGESISCESDAMVIVFLRPLYQGRLKC